MVFIFEIFIELNVIWKKRFGYEFDWLWWLNFVKFEMYFKRLDYKIIYGFYLCEFYNIVYYKLYLYLGKIL